MTENIIRLQKFLSLAGVCSRRKGEDYIKAGLVRVNGKVVTQMGIKIDLERDHVEYKNIPLQIGKKVVYIALNKPPGYVTSCKQPGEKIVMDLVQVPERIFPIGRLDKESTGLILLTNDGGLHQKLSHPSFNHEKEYEVTVGKPISDKALLKLSKGVTIRGSKTRPANVKRISDTQFLITLKEGRNRQIRKMVRRVENHVTNLRRTRIANIKLKRLAEGTWRHLTVKEKEGLIT